MQPPLGFAAIALALAATTQLASGLVAGTSAEAVAVAWLHRHAGAPPEADALAELKGTNPQAYAIVKALLTKRSLGLLDPRHPSASFAGPRAPPPSHGDQPSGAAAFEKIAEESGERPKVAPLYPDAPVAPTRHDWLSWKPQQSALDDDTMVKNVLGAVTELEGGAANKGTAASTADAGEGSSAKVSSQAAAAAPTDAGLLAAPAKPWRPATAPAQAVAAAGAAVRGSVTPLELDDSFSGPAVPATAMSQDHSYLKGINLGLFPPFPEPAKLPAKTNSYLKDIGLVADPPATAKAARRDYLAGFSFDDDGAAPTPAGGAGSTAALSAPAKVPKASGAFFAWLDGGKAKPAPAAPPPPPTPAQPKTNTYLQDLQ